MASFDRCSLKIIWIIIQVFLHLISPYATFSQFRSYAASIDYFPQLHPSENPDCSFRLSKDQLQDRQFKYQESFSIDHEPSIEIRAILSPCQASSGKPLDEHSRVKSNDTFYEDSDTSDHEGIRNCHKKLIITLKLNNVGKIRTEDEYIVVSHVLDPITMQKSRLLNPYVVKIRREPVLQLYRLKFEKVVNAEAREQIIITKEPNYTRCNDDIKNPTCGVLFDNGVPVPFSQGFCCSCDTEADTTRRTRKSKEETGNFFPKVKTIREESTNKSSNRSKSRAAYDRLFDDSKLSTVTRTNGIKRKQSHFTYNSRKLKENNIGNNLSTISNTDNDINDQQKMYKDDKTKVERKSSLTKKENTENVRKYVDKNDDNLENATRTILFSSKIPTKGKMEVYIDTIREEASRESRNLKNNENTTSFDYKDFVIESPLSSKGSHYEKCKKRKKKYKDDRIEDVESGRKNLMDELTELEKAYDALKKMRSKNGENRSSGKDESYERACENLEGKELEVVDNIEKNAKKKTLSDKRKMKMDAKVNENKMRETRRCFRLRKKMEKRRKKNEDRGDSNSRKSMGTFTSRLDEFQARSGLRSEGKIYEDQSYDIQLPRKMEFAKYPFTKNASISGNFEVRKSNGGTMDHSRESEVFALLTRLLVPDEEILRNLDIFEVKRGTRNLTPLKNNRSNENDLARRYVTRIKKSMRNGRKKLKRGEKYDFSSLSSSSGNLIKNIETNSREKNGSRSTHVYVQRPDFDLVTDKYLNEPSMDFNSSDNPFLIDEDTRPNGVDRSIEEKFGRISQVLKEASDEAKHLPLSSSNETSNLINENSQRVTDEKIQNLNFSKNKEKIGNIDISNNNQENKYIHELENMKKIQKTDLPWNNKKFVKFTNSGTNEKKSNLKVPWNFDNTERNGNVVDRIGHVDNMKNIQKLNLPLHNKKLVKLTNSKTNEKRPNLKLPWNFPNTKLNENANNKIGHAKNIQKLNLPFHNKNLVKFTNSKSNENRPNIKVPLNFDNAERNGNVVDRIGHVDDIKKIQKFLLPRNNKKLVKFTNSETNEKIRNLKAPWNFANIEHNKNAVDSMGNVEISSKVPTTNFVEFKGGTRSLEKVIPRDKSSFSSNPVNGVEKYTKKRPGESTDRINVRASNGSKQISDLIISRSRLNSTIVVVDGSRPRENGVSYLDVENSGIVLRKINSSDDTKTKLLYKMNERWKTFGKGRISPRNSALRIFDENSKLANDKLMNNLKTNKETNIKEKKITKPREIIFYEYNFDDDNDNDDRLYDFSRKSRTLLSIRLDDTGNQDEDELFDNSPNLEYEDYSYPKTDASKDKNEEDSMEDIFKLNSMLIPSKRKIDIDDSNYEDFSNNTNLDNLYSHNADKYIKQMSKVIAHRGNKHGIKFNEDENKKYKKIVSRGSKIVKKNVNDVPLYDFVSTQETSDDAEKMKNFNQAQNSNFYPENWNEKMNIDDPGIYDKEFDQNRERNEKSSVIDVSSYNTEDDKLKSSKLLQNKPMIEESNEFLMDPRRKLDETGENIDISVSGNIHVKGGIKGHPISIAFVAVPDTQPDSPTISNDSSFVVEKSDDSENGDIKLNEIVPGGPNDQGDTGSNVESMSNAFTDDSDKSKKESNSFSINNNDDEGLSERNKSSFSSFEPQNHIYNEVYKYDGIEKAREDGATPVQRLFVFNSKINEVDAKNLNSNDNFESSFVEEYEDDLEDDGDLKNLAREKKEAESFEYRMTDSLVDLMERESNESLPVSDENVTLIKIIPEKLFDNVPSVMKNDFSNNFQVNSYGDNLSSFEFPFSSNLSSVKVDSASDYRNTPSKLGSYNLADADSNPMIFPVILETTVQSNDILQDWYKDGNSKEMTMISKITEPDVLFRTMPTVKLSISDIQSPILKQTDNVTVKQTGTKFPEPEKSQLFNTTSTTTRTGNTIIGDSCYKMRVTVKKLNLSETTSAPTTTVSNVPSTVIKDIDQRNKTLGNSTKNNSSQTQNSTIRERNASAVANFIKKLQAFAPNEKRSQLNVREIVILPEDAYGSNITKSNNCLNLQINSNEASDEKDKTRLESRLENSYPDKSVPIILPSSNHALDNLTIAAKDSTKENKLRRKKTILESNSKLLSRTSKESFYPSSWVSSRKEQQHQRSPSRSSTKRSLSGGHDGSDKSFLFYAQQKQPVGLPELLVKSQDGNDIDLDLRSPGKRVFLGRNKRNEKNEVGFRSLEKKIKGVDEVSSLGRSLNEEEKETEVKSLLDSRKNSAREVSRLPRFNKRKLEKRKKKMDAGEIKKLTGIRRRKKKKKMKKMGNRENTLDIPEVKTKWRLVKRNLLSVGATESGRLKRKLGKKRDDGDLEITRKTYEESNASRVGRVLDGGSRRKKKKKKKKKKEEKVEDAGSTLIRRRQSRTDGKQVRGGQDCSNRDHPVDVDESKYLESAHCLRFSDLWYSVYRLDGPILDHGVSIQLYEKRSLPDGTTRWEDLTSSMIRLNTFSRRYRNNDDSLAFTYRAKREPSKQFPASLDILEDRLLVPSSVSSGKSFKVAEFKGIFDEYLIVRANEISGNGNECDKIGVGFKAFVDQPDRCGRLRGTCLKYQPLSYWKRDREAREAGRAGCYFLSNFASVPSEPIKYNVSGSGSGEFLALEYHSPHVSAIDIEVRNDYNGVASAGPLGRISHIYVDSTSSVHTLVTIVIRNVGSTPTVYRPRIVECPQGLPVSWSNAKGIVQMILPRQNRRVAFDLYGDLPFKDFECTVELLDRRGKIVASRRMKVRRMDRCFCVWHCLCACVGGADGLSCRPMSTAHYRAAGFQPPVPATPIRSSSFLGSLFGFLLFLFTLVALLLSMGVAKWIIGIYVPAVGRWGLDTLLESTRMREYFEEELKCRCIVTDESGLPVHPDTGSRSIRICSRKVEFFLNVTFFLIYPITVCWNCTRYFFRSTRYGSNYTSTDESKACLTSDRYEYQNLVTVSTYGDGRNTKMEAEDTNYVMNELKKSQESLQEYNRYKRYRYYLENQDSRY